MLSIIATGAMAAVLGIAPEADADVRPTSIVCTMASASPWIEKWFAAWELVSEGRLDVAASAPPEIVFFDSSCLYTTSAFTAGDAPVVRGPELNGMELPWRALAHGGKFTSPKGDELPAQLMSFADAGPQGPYFVMAAPSLWQEVSQDANLGLVVFLHEFAHTRQIPGVGPVIGSIDATWPYPEELNDDAVQTHFGSKPDYVTAYMAERDLFYRAARAGSLAEARRLAAEALRMIRRRHARWFQGEKAVFAALDNLFLSLEGAGQWIAYAWLAHPEGGGLDRESAIETMLGRRKRWSQDQGLALFLVVDRLLPEWPSHVFSSPSLGALDLLERAVLPPPESTSPTPSPPGPCR